MEQRSSLERIRESHPDGSEVVHCSLQISIDTIISVDYHCQLHHHHPNHNHHDCYSSGNRVGIGRAPCTPHLHPPSILQWLLRSSRQRSHLVQLAHRSSAKASASCSTAAHSRTHPCRAVAQLPHNLVREPEPKAKRHEGSPLRTARHAIPASTPRCHRDDPERTHSSFQQAHRCMRRRWRPPRSPQGLYQPRQAWSQAMPILVSLDSFPTNNRSPNHSQFADPFFIHSLSLSNDVAVSDSSSTTRLTTNSSRHFRVQARFFFAINIYSSDCFSSILSPQ